MLRLAAILLAMLVTGIWSGATFACGSAGIKVHMHGVEAYAADGLLYQPTGQAPFFAVLLISDQQGLSERVTAAAQCFANAGFVTVAIDLYRGGPTGAALEDATVMQDLGAALEFLERQSNVRKGGIGVLGWGSGGAYALRLARDPRVRALALEGGAPSADETPLAALHAAILGNYAAKDAAAPVRAVRRFESTLHRLGKDADIKIYVDAAVGFDDPQDTAHYRAEDANDAQRRRLSFFTNKLSRGAP